MNNKSRFSGIVPPLVTPLNKDEIVCKDSLHKLIDHCLNNGVSGVFVNGTSGEAMRVNDSVWEEMTKETLAYVGDRGVVFCGAIDSSTTRVIEKIKKIEALGGKIAVCT
ncbi:MAG: dihydrodipicolinate synthase family protein, partial [Clostridiaceae bacterium]|nr:dihydrodipicolinate synthase family protein [Clostridiaceae bacterium]